MSFRASAGVGLDGLVHMHDRYVEDFIFRALLSPNAAPVKKIIDGILALILTYYHPMPPPLL